MAKIDVTFRTQYMPHERVFTEKGSPEKVTYIGHYKDNGEFEVIPNGKKNLYNEIQSHADSVDIHVILARYKNGDVNALNQVAGAFGDFTGMPQNYAEMLNYLITEKDKFMKLPTDVREKFGNDFNRYMATAGTDDWLKNLGVQFEATEKAAEVLKDEKEVGEENE